jgi:hypothetical protein
LEAIRNSAIHFKPEVDTNDRTLALEATKTLADIIQKQFGAFSNSSPWFIPNIKGGACFVKKELELTPFIKEICIPNCVLVGPYHKVEFKDNRWVAIDEYEYKQKEIDDEEFAILFNSR